MIRSRTPRPVAWAAAVIAICLATACEAEKPTSTPPDTTASATASVSELDYPVPPGAKEWPVTDITSCGELEGIKGSKVVVRIPVASSGCLDFSHGVLVIATQEVGFADVHFNKEDRTDIELPGFDGTVRSTLESLSVGSLYVVEPTGSDVKYVVIWTGGTGQPIDEILAALFVV